MAPQLSSQCPTHAVYDYVIVGAGPAGLQMAYFLHKSNRKYVVFEASPKAASFFQQHPKHGRLLSLNKKYNMFEEEEFNMRHDWNSLLSHDAIKFTSYSDDLYPQAGQLHDYLNDFAVRHELNIKYKTRVTKVSKPSSTFLVNTECDDMKVCKARCVLMATGAVDENLPQHIEGIELADTYSKHDTNGDIYRNKMILVIGGGNSSFETANHLSGSAAIVHVAFDKRIQFAWDTHAVGDLRAVNNNILDMYHLKSLHSTIGSHVTKIVRGENGKLKVTFKDLNTHWQTPGWLYFDMEYDHVISCMGWNYVQPHIFDETIKIETVRNGRYPRLSNCWETDTENLFYIGTNMAAIDKQSASGFIHGFRYNIRTLSNLLENRFFQTPLANTTLNVRDLQSIAERVIQRSTINDALYQMNGFLCDVITVDDDDSVTYYTELPRNYVMEIPQFKTAPHVFVFHLSYGFDKFGSTAKPIDNVHAPDFSSNRCASFLHPYIEYHRHGEYIDQTELQESLIVRYDNYSNSKFPQWTSATNENYIKYFINNKVKWTKEVFNLTPLPQQVLQQIFVPLTEEERSRLPPLYEKSECKPSQELLPSKVTPMGERRLRPTRSEMLSSLSQGGLDTPPASPNMSPQTARISGDKSTEVTSRQ